MKTTNSKNKLTIQEQLDILTTLVGERFDQLGKRITKLETIKTQDVVHEYVAQSFKTIPDGTYKNGILLKATNKELPIERKSDQELLDFLRPAFVKGPEPQSRITLRWPEAYTFRIEWNIGFDPAALDNLKPGTQVDIQVYLDEVHITYCGLHLGKLPKYYYSRLLEHWQAGAKFYAFMRSDRRITIKVGYPQ